MNEKSLRKLVREEIEGVLNEKVIIDSHPKFRQLVEAKLGRPFQDSGDGWSVTYKAWTDAVMECSGIQIDAETLDYYVLEATLQLARQP